MTVGTHEQQFNRLVKNVDELCRNHFISDVFIQRGYSTYTPVYCKYIDFLTYDQMERYLEEATLVISHGGPSTFMHSLSLGKRTIVVPRRKKFGEHVNNHQLKFAEEVKRKGYSIEIVEDISNLGNEILNNDYSNVTLKTNNERFNDELIKAVKSLHAEDE